MCEFSGQSDEPTDEDYNGNYDEDNTSDSVEVTPSNLSTITTVIEGANERTTDEISETSIILSTTTATTVPFTEPTANPMETGKAIETTTGCTNVLVVSVLTKTAINLTKWQ